VLKTQKRSNNWPVLSESLTVKSQEAQYMKIEAQKECSRPNRLACVERMTNLLGNP